MVMFICLYVFDMWQKGMRMYLLKTCCSFCIDGHFMYQQAAQCLGRHTESKGSFRFGHKVRSECLRCIFRASCCSAHLSWAQVGGKKWDRLHWWVQESTSSPTYIGSRWRVWSLMNRFVSSAAITISHTINICAHEPLAGLVQLT